MLLNLFLLEAFLDFEKFPPPAISSLGFKKFQSYKGIYINLFKHLKSANKTS